MIPKRAVAAALGDGTRQAIVELLAERPRSVGELADALPVTRPAVSLHLKVLRDAHLVQATPVGTRRVYRLDPEGLDLLRTYLDHLWAGALDRFAVAAEAAHRPTRTEAESAVADHRRRRRATADPGGAQSDDRTHRHHHLSCRASRGRGRPGRHLLSGVRRRASPAGGHPSTTWARTAPWPTSSSSRSWAVACTTSTPKVGSASGAPCWPSTRPTRLVFAWHIQGDWTVDLDPARQSEAEVTFTAIDDTHTAVHMEHRRLERHGAGAAGRGARASRSEGGWTVLLGRFADVAEGRAPRPCPVRG